MIGTGKVRRIDFSPSEWLEGTHELDNAERGLYITACALMYARGGSIEESLLRSFCKQEDLRRFKRALARLIHLAKLDLKDGYLSNKRCLSELQSAANRSLSAAQNVSKRWAKSKQNNEIDDTAVLQGGKANHQPSTINHQPSDSPTHAQHGGGIDAGVPKAKAPNPRALGTNPRAKGTNPRAIIDAEFETLFWPNCPRKVGKGQAIKAYSAARKTTEAELILAGIKAYARQRAGEDQTYTAHPATWLNGRRWLDQDQTPPAPPMLPAPPTVRLVTIRGRTIEDTSGLPEWEYDQLEEVLSRERDESRRLGYWSEAEIEKQRAVMLGKLKYPPESADEILGKPKDSRVPGTAAFAAAQAETARRCEERMLRGAKA